MSVIIGFGKIFWELYAQDFCNALYIALQLDKQLAVKVSADRDFVVFSHIKSLSKHYKIKVDLLDDYTK